MIMEKDLDIRINYSHDKSEIDVNYSGDIHKISSMLAHIMLQDENFGNMIMEGVKLYLNKKFKSDMKINPN